DDGTAAGVLHLDDHARPSFGRARLLPSREGSTGARPSFGRARLLPSREGSTGASPSLLPASLESPPQYVQFALKWPIFCAGDQSVSHGIVYHILPLRIIAFLAAKPSIPVIRLPAVGSVFVFLAELGLPVFDPVFQREFGRPRRGK